MGPTLGRLPLLAGWRVSGTNRRAVGILDSACKELTHTSLLSKQGREGGLKLHGWLASFLKPA